MENPLTPAAFLKTRIKKPKRIFLRDLEQHDIKKDDSVVRQLEMIVDSCITSPGYTLQFWTDVRVYGVDEAILYVLNGNHGNAFAIKEEWEKIKVRLT
jgi:hypothetical protein